VREKASFITLTRARSIVGLGPSLDPPGIPEFLHQSYDSGRTFPGTEPRETSFARD